MEKETLVWVVNEFRNMTRDLVIYEVRPQIQELQSINTELTDSLRRAVESAERLAADTKGIAELQRQIADQLRHIEKLEKQLEDTEFKRGNLEAENAALARRCEVVEAEKQDLDVQLKEAESELYLLGRSNEQSDKDGYVNEDEEQALVDELAETIEGRKKINGHD